MVGGFRRVTDRTDVFLSYSHNDLDAAVNLRGQLDRHGLSVFRDAESIRAGDLWLDRSAPPGVGWPPDTRLDNAGDR